MRYSAVTQEQGVEVWWQWLSVRQSSRRTSEWKGGTNDRWAAGLKGKLILMGEINGLHAGFGW